MPVRSLSSSVLRWPNRSEVDSAVHRWADEVSNRCDDVILIGYFGSYARGDWGVGSDLDLVVILERSGYSSDRRSIAWDTTGLPVPADLLVYTSDEWRRMADSRFRRTIESEAVWVYRRGGDISKSNQITSDE